VTAANVNDGTPLVKLLDAIPPLQGKRGRPRRRPEQAQGDRAYGSAKNQNELRARGIKPVLAKPRTEHGSGLGKTRWVVERTLAWLHSYRRLRVRYERRADLHEAFLKLGCILICWNHLKHSFC